MPEKNKQSKVALVGHTNVGKSTLFNRLTESRQALTSKIAGTTRDLKYGICRWRGQDFEIIDTGGLEIFSKDELSKKINQQIQRALAQADLLLFIVNGQEGLLPQDIQLARQLQKFKKPLILAVNKIDNLGQQEKINQFFKLGCGQPWAIAAINGSGIGDLLDVIMKELPLTTDQPASTAPLRLTLIGKPNVGKSSLVNAILGEERVIVSDQPHTTREPQDTLIHYQDKDFLLIDTAGIRHKSKIKFVLEKLGVQRSIGVLQRADIAALVVEASQPLASQDKKLTQIIQEAQTGVIIIANKWDLVPNKDTQSEKKFTDYFRQYFPYLTWAPIIFVSAKIGQRVKKILDLCLAIQLEREKFIEQKTLNTFLKKMVKIHRPAQNRGVKHPYIYEIKQIGIKPPTFLIITDKKSNLHPSYLSFIENRLRERFGFQGTAIRIREEERS